MADAYASFSSILAETPFGRSDFEGSKTRRVYALFGKTRAMDGPAIHPVVLAVLDRVLGHYQLSAPTGIEIGAGEHAQPLHPDDAIYPLPRPHPELVVNVMWPLEDFTEANGATRVVPGSHRWVDEVPTADTPTRAVEMPAGAALLYLGSLWHGGGANRTGSGPARRRAPLLGRLVAPGREPRAGGPAGPGPEPAGAAPGAARLQHPAAVHRLRRRPPP